MPIYSNFTGWGFLPIAAKTTNSKPESHFHKDS
jgi:hypothetical protein